MTKLTMSYTSAVEWLADQDTHDDDLEDLTVRDRPATKFGAAAYGVPVERMAGDVIEHRAQLRGLKLCKGCVEFVDANDFVRGKCSSCWVRTPKVPR